MPKGRGRGRGRGRKPPKRISNAAGNLARDSSSEKVKRKAAKIMNKWKEYLNKGS